ESARKEDRQAQGEGMMADEIDTARAPPRPARCPPRHARRCRGRRRVLTHRYTTRRGSHACRRGRRRPGERGRLSNCRVSPVMDTNLLDTKFAHLGARLKVADRTAPRSLRVAKAPGVDESRGGKANAPPACATGGVALTWFWGVRPAP